MTLRFDDIRLLLIAGMLALSLSAFGCGTDLGAMCDVPGSDECVDGAMCTNESGGGATCRAICLEHADCAEDESCNGVENTNIKTCQPD